MREAKTSRSAEVFGFGNELLGVGGVVMGFYINVLVGMSCIIVVDVQLLMQQVETTCPYSQG